MSDNPLDQVSDLVRALNTLSLALENNPQQRAPAAASAAPAGSSPAREDSFELITEEPSPSQVQGIRTQPVQIAYNNNSFAETIPPVPHWILRDCQSLVAGELGKQAFEQPPLCKAESGHLEHLRAFHFVQRSTSSFEHLDWKHQQECQTLRIFTGSQDAWKEATWCAALSHHCLKPRPIVKEPDSASLHNINGADPKKVPGRSADDQDHSIYMQAAIVLFREGEALLALPGLAISDEVLDSYAAMIDPGQEALVGPCCRVVCRLMDLDQDLDLDTQAEVLLVDMDFAQTETLLMDFQPAQEAHHEAVSFEEGLHHAIPIPSQVLGLARDWIAAQEEQERLDYHTAQQKAVPVTPGGIPQLGTSPKGKPPGPKRAAPKRASLQNQVETLLGALPTLTLQLDRVRKPSNRTWRVLSPQSLEGLHQPAVSSVIAPKLCFSDRSTS